MAELNTQSQIRERAIAELDDLIHDGASITDAYKQAVTNYPQEAAILSDYVANYAAMGEPSIEIDADPSLMAIVDSTASRIAARMRAQTVFPGLLARAKNIGIDQASLALKLRLAMSVLRKLDQRMIVLASIPAALIESLSEVLRVEASSIRYYLLSTPTLATNADYKSHRTPNAGNRRQSFDTAVRSSANIGEMSPEDMDFWLASSQGENE